MLISIEGNIGAGKSEFIRRIDTSAYNIITITEPIDKNKRLLELYYEDPDRWAFPFQLAMLTSRAHIHYDIQRRYSDKNIVIERSIYTDYHIFSRLVTEAGYMEEWERQRYNMIFDDMMYFVREPDVFLYLNIDIEFALKRIAQRGRSGEENITIEYLKHIKSLYDEWLLNNERTVVVDISADLSNAEINEIVRGVIFQYV